MSGQARHRGRRRLKRWDVKSSGRIKTDENPSRPLHLPLSLKNAVIKRPGQPLTLQHQDLVYCRRQAPPHLAIMAIADNSWSMAVGQGLGIIKKTLSELCDDAYLRRDRLGIIQFNGKRAEVLHPITHNPRTARAKVEQIKAGARTPLPEALHLLDRQLNTYRARKGGLPVALVFTDGKPNIPYHSAQARPEALRYAEKLARQNIPAVVVDTSIHLKGERPAAEMARVLKATYLLLKSYQDGQDLEMEVVSLL